MRPVLLVPCAVLFAVCVSSARADIGEGNWEIEIATAMGGAPAQTGPAGIKQTQCIRPEDTKDPGKLFGGPVAGCEFTNRRDDGSAYRFDLACAIGAIPMNGSGEMRYTRDSLEGEIVIRVSAGGQTMEMRSRIKATRIGPCR